MIESFVDLTYRGLSLGRRVKLNQVRPSTGFLEMPTPMPVGTAIALATDEGVAIEAVVTAIHEQVGGVDAPPGMTVAPRLVDEASVSWWRARVALPDEVKVAVGRTKSVTVRPRSHTIPTPTPDAALIGQAHPEPPNGKTLVMEAVTADADQLAGGSGNHPIVDDGQRTMVMDAVQAPEGTDDADSDDDAGASASGTPVPSSGSDAPRSSPGGGKKRRKRR